MHNPEAGVLKLHMVNSAMLLHYTRIADACHTPNSTFWMVVTLAGSMKFITLHAVCHLTLGILQDTSTYFVRWSFRCISQLLLWLTDDDPKVRNLTGVSCN